MTVATAGEWDADSAIAQIEKCAFECEGGPLANNVAWRFMRDTIAAGPKYLPGQWVWFEVSAEAVGVTLTQWVRFCVVGVSMSSDTDGRTWKYALSFDPPDAWHYGTAHFSGVAEAKIRLAKPEAATGEQPA